MSWWEIFESNPAHIHQYTKCQSTNCNCDYGESINFKVACLVCQSLSGQAPVYPADDCCLVSDSARRSLRSSDVQTYVVPRTYISYGNRTFAAAGPRLWNFLPVQLRNPDITYGLFRRQLKGHLLGTMDTALCDF